MMRASVIICFVAAQNGVWSADGESAAVVIMGDIVINYRIRCPYFKSIHRPPFACLRGVKPRAAVATNVACYGWRVRARQTLHKDATAKSRPGYVVESDDAVVSRKGNPSTRTKIVNNAPMIGPDPSAPANKDRSGGWPRSRHCPA